MSLRTIVTFEWQTLPEPVPDPYSDTLSVGSPGSGLLGHVGHHLMQQGFSIIPVHSDRGSDPAFGIESGGVRICCVVKDGHPSLLATEVHGWSKTSRERRNPLSEHSRVCSALHECLANSSRATAVRWYTRRDFERGNVEAGADRP